jgi:hypothetical protein
VVAVEGVQLRGTATLIEDGPLYAPGMTLLVERYPQYATVPLAGRPLLAITPTSVRSWRAAELARGV